MIYWFRDECNKIVFEDGGDKTVNEILSNIKNDLWLHDFDSAGDEEYEFVFYNDGKIIKIIKLTHVWTWCWDKDLYENYPENNFYIEGLNLTTDPKLVDLDYILKYKMGIIS